MVSYFLPTALRYDIVAPRSRDRQTVSQPPAGRKVGSLSLLRGARISYIFLEHSDMI